MASDAPQPSTGPDTVGPDDQTTIDARLLTPRVAVVAPAGDVDTATAGPLRAAIGEQVDAGAVHVVLDLSGVEFMGSAGLALLIAEREAAIAREGELRLAGVPRTAGRALSLTGLTELFDTYPDAEAAAADLS
ncbi:STAS domain-containing protein [Actinomycetospora chibensis]|uniref:Anti-sigma factor antagonist n=1 Tax=Actinomycetospora chibensis TaxID=663606 RepID=A0ABV9RR97_9PSEU|nr:STAS domain-containing protein [Actinomycetospora chibensis]MDD7926917.1 STAS domain-containing protein [Actinomycetospora chibensis]